MRRIILFLTTILVSIFFLDAIVHAQPGPGPGPTPSPWIVSGSQIYYGKGCVTVSATLPGPCHGIGSFSADTLWINGTQLTSPFSVAVGGTGASTLASHGVLLGNGTSAVSTIVGTTGSYLKGVTGSAPVFGTLATDAVTTLNFGAMGLTPSTATSGAITVAGTLVVSNGGTGASTLTSNGVLLGNGTGVVGATAAGATGTYLKGVTSGAPVFGTLASDAVTTLSFGAIGLTPSTATSGAITVAGTLVVSNGGTGAGTLTGVLKGNGTSPFTAATAGSDYVAPGTATTFTAKQTFAGTSSNLAAALVNASEPATISATAATGTINYDVCTQSILYYTTNASANWTLNVRCSSGTSLNTAMAVGDVATITFLVTQGASPFYNNVLTIDSGANTPKCLGGTCPSAGNASGIDIYTYAIIKTANATFTVIESQTQAK